ncbi:MAG: hypothetical protein MJZ15_03510 [Bacteroidales bacterium]|nr:hypothetical protein [Bacteroidales bacterium]
MSGIVDISKNLMGLEPGFTVRDLLVNMQNYYLEATPMGFRIMPDVESIRDVEEIFVNLGHSFGNFGLRVVSMEILPDEDVEMTDVIPDAMAIPCVAASSITRDADGVERILLTFK